MSNGHSGGPNPPEVDNVEVVYVEGHSVLLRGVTNEGKPVQWIRLGETEYYSAGQHFKLTADPLPADNVPPE